MPTSVSAASSTTKQVESSDNRKFYGYAQSQVRMRVLHLLEAKVGSGLGDGEV